MAPEGRCRPRWQSCRVTQTHTPAAPRLKRNELFLHQPRARGSTGMAAHLPLSPQAGSMGTSGPRDPAPASPCHWIPPPLHSEATGAVAQGCPGGHNFQLIAASLLQPHGFLQRAKPPPQNQHQDREWRQSCRCTTRPSDSTARGRQGRGRCSCMRSRSQSSSMPTG